LAGGGDLFREGGGIGGGFVGGFLCGFFVVFLGCFVSFVGFVGFFGWFVGFAAIGGGRGVFFGVFGGRFGLLWGSAETLEAYFIAEAISGALAGIGTDGTAAEEKTKAEEKEGAWEGVEVTQVFRKGWERGRYLRLHGKLLCDE
jgi:hypothetical protein